MPVQGVNFLPPDLQGEDEGLQRQRRLADALLAKGMADAPSGQMVGRFYVPQSPLQGLSRVFQTYLGAKGGENVDAARGELGRRAQASRADAIARALQVAQGAPGQAENTSGEGTGSFDMSGASGPAVTGQRAPNPLAAYGILAASGDPMAMQAGGQMLGFVQHQQEGAENRASRLQERILALDAAAQNAALSREERAQRAQEAEALRREMQANQQAFAAQQAALQRSFSAQQAAEARAARGSEAGRPPQGFRWKPDGSLERIPGGPADIKAEAELQKKSAGAGDVEIALGTLRDAYDRLEKGGGITSTNNSGVGNVLPALSSSGVGQAAGKIFGTQNQSARNDIAMARPALLAALMKATGMSAKQMDSNAELKLWLSTATDPTLDVESNRRALANIEKKYLGGSSSAPTPPRVVDW